MNLFEGFTSECVGKKIQGLKIQKSIDDISILNIGDQFIINVDSGWTTIEAEDILLDVKNVYLPKSWYHPGGYLSINPQGKLYIRPYESLTFFCYFTIGITLWSGYRFLF
jgi:hypothetical protein